MICQGCGKEVEPNDLHTYYDCLRWVRLHPEDEQKVTLKRMYYGKVSIVTEKKNEGKQQ